MTARVEPIWLCSTFLLSSSYCSTIFLCQYLLSWLLNETKLNPCGKISLYLQLCHHIFCSSALLQTKKNEILHVHKKRSNFIECQNQLLFVVVSFLLGKKNHVHFMLNALKCFRFRSFFWLKFVIFSRFLEYISNIFFIELLFSIVKIWKIISLLFDILCVFSRFLLKTVQTYDIYALNVLEHSKMNDDDLHVENVMKKQR